MRAAALRSSRVAGFSHENSTEGQYSEGGRKGMRSGRRDAQLGCVEESEYLPVSDGQERPKEVVRHDVGEDCKPSISSVLN
jgi:hypothetical protein